MGRYSSRRHRVLMDASEHALRDATESPSPRESRIASTILGDGRVYRQWEMRHADLLLPVAQQGRKKPQIIELRKANVQLVHRHAFFNYLQTHSVSENQRQRLFRIFHATMDFQDAVLAEHRQYMLAVSSKISTDHIVEVMEDPNTASLIQQYESTFARYYEMKCYLACARESNCIQLVNTSLRETRASLLTIQRRIETEVPAGYGGSFEQQELLARSGRYQAVNYLNA